MVLGSWKVVRAAFAVSALVALAACSPERSGDELFAPGGDNIPVVNAVMVVGRPFPDVYVSRTLRPDEPFSWQRAGIAGAIVEIEFNGIRERYADVGDFPGHYSELFSTIVNANTTYHLTVTLPDGRVLKATTTTPSPIDVSDWVLLNDGGTQVVQHLSEFTDSTNAYLDPENQLTYPNGLLEVRLQNGGAIAYQMGLQSLDINSELLIDADFLSDDDLENFTRVNSSPPLEAPERNLRVPWFAIYYQGRYIMRVCAMDRNWFDLARTDPVLGNSGIGFGGEAGDNTARPIFHVDGGIGLFGSMSSDSVGFYVHAPAN